MRWPLVLTLLVFILHDNDVNARPITSPFVSVPIQRLHSRVDPNLPSAIVHQQHINRAIRRLERMGHARDSLATTDRDLLSAIQRRALSLPEHIQRRFYHPDVPLHFGHGNPRLGGQFKASDSSGGRPGVTPAATPTFPHSLGLDIQAKDIGYLATVQLGTPPRDFLLLVDSGSADTWVGGENCQSSDGDGDCGPHTFLGPGKSITFTDTKQPWNITYGTGAVEGTIVIDNIAIAGLQLINHTFGVAMKETIEFTPDVVPFDGLLGLAKSSVSQQKTITVLEQLVKQKKLKQPVASYHIPRLADSANHGELTLGAMNPAKFISDTMVEVSNVNPFGFWQVALDDVYAGGEAMGFKDRTAILDTGTTLIIAPQADVDAVHKNIPGAYFDSGSWIIPCAQHEPTSRLFALKIGGRVFDVIASDLPFWPVDEEQPTGNCTSGITANIFDEGSQWLVGDVFLKNVYMSTNAATDTVSIAKLKSTEN